MVIKTGKEKISEVEIEVKQGTISLIDKYKYLGNWINEKGNKDIEELEKVQGKALKKIFKLPDSTPYYGILLETGMCPMYERVLYKRANGSS